MITYPVKVEKDERATFCYIRDARDRVIAGGLLREDAEEIVNALNNTYAEIENLRNQQWNAERVIQWMDDPERKPAIHAFTAGNERQIAYRFERLVEEPNSQPKKKSKKIQIEEALRRSDLSAQLAERTDVEYGHHDCLPRGEHVARLQKNHLK